MQTPDPLRLVAQELATLRRGDRRAILAAFDDDARARLQVAMRGDEAVIGSNPVNGRHSAWISELLSDASAAKMTRAARAALIEAVGAPAPSPAARQTARTLLQAAGGLLNASVSR